MHATTSLVHDGKTVFAELTHEYGNMIFMIKRIYHDQDFSIHESLPHSSPSVLLSSIQNDCHSLDGRL